MAALIKFSSENGEVWVNRDLVIKVEPRRRADDPSGSANARIVISGGDVVDVIGSANDIAIALMRSP